MECPSIINQTVYVEAKVKVSPEVCIGDPDVCCLKEPDLTPCCDDPSGCTYMVDQLIHVRFPISFSVSVMAKPAGIICCKPKEEPCASPPCCSPEKAACPPPPCAEMPMRSDRLSSLDVLYSLLSGLKNVKR